MVTAGIYLNPLEKEDCMDTAKEWMSAAGTSDSAHPVCNRKQAGMPAGRQRGLAIRRTCRNATVEYSAAEAGGARYRAGKVQSGWRRTEAGNL